MLPATVSDQEFRAQVAIKDRLIDYWADVDRNGALSALEYYTQDCVYIMCDHRMEGHADIKRYYDYRASRGDRLVRHVASNLRVHVHADAPVDTTVRRRRRSACPSRARPPEHQPG